MSVLLVAAAVGCGGGDETSVRLEVSYDDAWALDAFELTAGGELDRGEAARTVRVIVPDGWAGRALSIEIDGRRGGERIAHGATEVTPVAGDEVRATMVLTRLPCGAWCTAGSTACNGDGVVVCEQRDDDTCMEWSDPAPCGADGPFCSLGVCDDTCIDECAPGETRCTGPGGVQVCGEADSDTCHDWLAVTACGDGETCSNGACTTVCQDECEPGQVMCAGTGTSTCGDLDFDGCFEWGPIVPCPGAQTCSGGTCSDSCTDECTTSSCAGLSYTECGQFDLDPCADRSPGMSCVPADPCRDGMCTAGGCTSAPKVCDQPGAPFCVDDFTLRTFSSPGTCSAGDCDYPVNDTTCPDGCSAGACIGGCREVCASEALAADQGAVSVVAVDATHIYWSGDLGVYRLPVAGGIEEMIATDRSYGIATDATHIYWTGYAGDVVRRRAKSGGAVEAIASGQDGAYGIAIDSSHVYWTNSSGGQVMRVAKAGGTPETIATTQQDPRGIALDATYVYWSSHAGDKVVRRAKSGGTIETLATGQVGANRVAVDATHVYWTNYPGGEVRRKPLAGGAIDTIATGQDGPTGVALDASHVYWGVYNTGRVDRRAKSGGAVQNLAMPPMVSNVAVDDDYVYWVTYAGLVERLAKCACGL